MSMNVSERIAEAIASTRQPVGEARWASLVVPPPETREDALAVISETRRLIVTAEWHAAEMGGATWEMSQNAKRRLPVLRAEVSRAELALRVLDEVDAEPAEFGLLDGVGALFAVAMLAAMAPAVLASAMTAVPPAVTLFAVRQRPQHVLRAACAADDAERELARLRPLSCVEDWQDREDALARHHAARKTLATVPTRIGGAS